MLMKINILLYIVITRKWINIFIKKLILLKNGLRTKIRENINKLFLNHIKLIMKDTLIYLKDFKFNIIQNMRLKARQVKDKYF